MAGFNSRAKGRRAAWALASASLLAVAAAPARAQNASPAEPAIQAEPAPDTPVEAQTDTGDIIVTAQRRNQSLTKVGLSITAVDGETLANRNITQAEDLAKLVPGLSVSDSGFSTPIYTLRGVGVNEPSAGSSSSVAVYVDEVPLAFPVLTQGAAFDLERVEVLKGPQGTLYGQNSTGGAINYIAAKPTDSFEAGVLGTVGRFTRGQVEGYVSGPIGDTLKARVAGRYAFGDDWQRSITRDAGLGRIENYTGRAIVEWEPSSAFRATLNVNGWVDKSDTTAAQLVAVFPGTNARVDRDVVVVDAANNPVIGANGLVVTRPELLPGDNARDADWDAGVSLTRDDRFVQGSLRLDLDVSDQVTLTSITSYADFDRESVTDFDGIAISTIYRGVQTSRIKSFAQELRLSAEFGPVQWLIGANYGRDRTRDLVDQDIRESSQVQNLFGFPVTGAVIDARQRIENFAAFTNIEIELTEQLSVSGGVRLSNDERKFRGCGTVRDESSTRGYTALLNFFRQANGLAPVGQLAVGDCIGFYTTAAAAAEDTENPPLFTSTLSNRELEQDNVPWTLNVNWNPTPDSLIYGRISRGFKAGNFSTLNTTDNIAYRPVVQEQLTAYEIGARASFGRLLRIEGAIFQYDYLDKQLRARIAVGPPFGNINAQDTIPESRIRGAEASVVLRPADGLTLSASGTYIDSEIREYVGQTVDGVLQDQSGSPFNFTPEWSFNGDLNYERPITASLGGFVGVNVAYRSETSAVFDPPGSAQNNLDLFDIRKNTVVDAQLGVEGPDGRWRAFVWGKNVFNEYYWTNVVRVADVVAKYAAQPATYGATVSFRF